VRLTGIRLLTKVSELRGQSETPTEAHTDRQAPGLPPTLLLGSGNSMCLLSASPSPRSPRS